MTEAAVVVAACALACLLCLLNRSGSHRRFWSVVAAAMAIFGAYKHWHGQAALIGHVQAAARAGGWYAERHGVQWAAVAIVGLGGAALIYFGAVARRLGTPARGALALTVLLLIYVLLGAISNHAWDQLVSRKIAGIRAYTLVEVAIPALVALCALAARFGSRRRRFR